ncbi:MAG: tetratricopeptide repeat protein [Candidatus Brocadiia bacterium]
MAKTKYKEAKQDDKFHATLSAAWGKLQPYVLPIGIGAGLILLVAAAWVFLAQRSAARSERPWAERHQLEVATGPEASKTPEEHLEKLADLAREYQGEPAAAIFNLELALNHFRLAHLYAGLGSGRGELDSDAAEGHLAQAASAAEQFVSDFPDHPLLPLAHLEAGKARMELEQYEAAASHFEQAALSPVPFAAAVARWHAARCYEKLGRLAEAREAYQTLRDTQMAGWVAQLAEYDLARLDRQAPKGE